MELLLGFGIVGLVLLLVFLTQREPCPANLSDDALMLEIQAVSRRLVAWSSTEPLGTPPNPKRTNKQHHFLALLHELEQRDAQRYQELMASTHNGQTTPDAQAQALAAYFSDKGQQPESTNT